MKILRLILGVVLGLAAALLVVTIAETAGMKAYPPPPGVNTKSMEEMKDVVAHMPVQAMLFVLTGYIFGAYAGPAVGMLVSGRQILAAAIPAVLFVAATVYNLAVLPSPLWFNVAAGIGELAAIALAILPLRKKPVLATA